MTLVIWGWSVKDAEGSAVEGYGTCCEEFSWEIGIEKSGAEEECHFFLAVRIVSCLKLLVELELELGDRQGSTRWAVFVSLVTFSMYKLKVLARCN